MLKNVKFVKFERRDKYFCNVKRSKFDNSRRRQ